MLVDVDLNFGAYQNARKYYDFKKQAANKEQKTLGASEKALKSAEQKAMEILKHVQVKTGVNKQRKGFWFEKFLWFISSEDYLVIGGRDAQQNELLVKRYLKPGDVYVHADLRGASSVIVKNRVVGAESTEVPPKTLNEAGAMAVCFSAAWDAKVTSGAWWVQHDQVSKTAPSGEYLTPGSFMIRGKKNYLPSIQLQVGFGFLFRLEEECVERHRGERRRLVGLSRETSVNMGQKVDDLNLEENHQLGNKSNEESESEESNEEFPDVQVRLPHLNIARRTEDEEGTILQLGPRRPEPMKPYPNPPVSSVVRDDHFSNGKSEEVSLGSQMEYDNQKTGSYQLKRGQKHKQKKLKQKYRDQDEVERQIRMEILGSAGDQKVKGKKNKKKAAETAAKLERKQRLLNASSGTKLLRPDENSEKVIFEESSQTEETAVVTDKLGTVSSNQEEVAENLDALEEPEEAEEEPEEQLMEIQNEMTNALDCLTGIPVADDLLMFAVPVCGPYNAMLNYKFKVKLTPGTGKKGKAVKTALFMFLNDKETTEREKDLLKAVADQDLSRNIPGKVKVSAPQLMVHRQKMQKQHKVMNY